MWLPVRLNVFHLPHEKAMKNSCDVKIHAAQEYSQTFHLRFATDTATSMQIAITRTHVHTYTHAFA